MYYFIFFTWILKISPHLKLIGLKKSCFRSYWRHLLCLRRLCFFFIIIIFFIYFYLCLGLLLLGFLTYRFGCPLLNSYLEEFVSLKLTFVVVFGIIRILLCWLFIFGIFIFEESLFGANCDIQTFYRRLKHRFAIRWSSLKFY